MESLCSGNDTAYLLPNTCEFDIERVNAPPQIIVLGLIAPKGMP